MSFAEILGWITLMLCGYIGMSLLCRVLRNHKELPIDGVWMRLNKRYHGPFVPTLYMRVRHEHRRRLELDDGIDIPNAEIVAIDIDRPRSRSTPMQFIVHYKNEQYMATANVGFYINLLPQLGL